MSVLQPNTIYNIVENTISQNAIKYVDALDNSVDKIISIGSTGLSLKRDILTSVKETILTPLDITDVNTGNSISFADLTYLPIGLGALTVPSNGTTCNFNDAIQLQNYDSTLAPPPTHSEVKIGSNPSTLYGMNIDTTTGNPFIITGNSGLTANITDDISLTSVTKSVTLTAEDNLSLVSSALGNINLDAPNVNSYGFGTAICFTRERSDTFSYTLGTGSAPQPLENVYTNQINIPYQFVSDNPVSGYTSGYWKIDFALNCYNSTNLGDKGLALYVVFEDQNTNLYLPSAYNATTPYAKWQNAATYNDGALTSFQNFNWSDVVDFTSLLNTGSGNVPLNIRLYVAGNTNFTTNFTMVLTLTRTNVV